MPWWKRRLTKHHLRSTWVKLELWSITVKTGLNLNRSESTGLPTPLCFNYPEPPPPWRSRGSGYAGYAGKLTSRPWRISNPLSESRFLAALLTWDCKVSVSEALEACNFVFAIPSNREAWFGRRIGGSDAAEEARDDRIGW
jgi:hypothetical protein